MSVHPMPPPSQFQLNDLCECADYARQWLPQSDVHGREMALRQTASELSEYARILETSVNITPQKGMTRYPILPDNCGLRVWRIVEGNCLDNCHRMNGGNYSYWGAHHWHYAGRSYDVSVPGYLDILPVPQDCSEPIELRIWLATHHETSVIPSLLWDEHRSAMREGFLWNMLNMVGAEWSDPRAAADRRLQFELHLSRARTTAEKRHTTAFANIPPPRVL